MEAYDVIISRRSIRRYTAEPISDENLIKIVKAGLSAPSAGNQQPWHIVIIKDHKIMDEVPKFHQYANMLKQASAAILVCGDESLQTHVGYWTLDCSAATENMLLAAHALGIGAVWLGIYPREQRIKGMRELLSIPETITPFALISLGYAAEQKPPANRYNESRIHYNKW